MALKDSQNLSQGGEMQSGLVSSSCWGTIPTTEGLLCQQCPLVVILRTSLAIIFPQDKKKNYPTM